MYVLNTSFSVDIHRHHCDIIQKSRFREITVDPCHKKTELMNLPGPDELKLNYFLDISRKGWNWLIQLSEIRTIPNFGG